MVGPNACLDQTEDVSVRSVIEVAIGRVSHPVYLLARDALCTKCRPRGRRYEPEDH